MKDQTAPAGARRMCRALRPITEISHMPCTISQPLGLFRGLYCNIHGVPPLQWLGQCELETERPPYRDPALHFRAPRFASLRERGRNGEIPATENKREVLMRRACALTPSPRSILLRTQPTGLMAPAWRLLHVLWRASRDLTARLHPRLPPRSTGARLL